MSKPVRSAILTTMDELKADVSALFDTGAFHSLIREDKLPAMAMFTRLKTPKFFGTADSSGKLMAIGVADIELHVENHDIFISTFVVPSLTADLIVGARDMQGWDISIKNENGHTTVHIGHDLKDPDVQTVL